MDKDRVELMEEYGINNVSGGEFGNGFFTCLKSLDNDNIKLFNKDHVIKTITFAKKHKLNFDWLLAQLKHDFKRKKGTDKKLSFIVHNASKTGGKE